MKKKTIVLITAEFPFAKGETFIESEILYWNNINKYDFILMPSRKSSIKRIIPKSIELSNELSSQKMDIFKKFINIPKVFVLNIFYKELLNSNFKIKSFPFLINSVVKFIIYKNQLQKFIKKNYDKDIIFYTYWHNEITYALQSLSKKHQLKIVTRTHRYDLYKEERKNSYMPLKSLFTKNINNVFIITDSARDYLFTTYGFDKSIIETARLGVKDLSIITNPTNKNNLHIVSCSSLIEVKRVDKIIHSLGSFSKLHPNLKIYWTHFGDGYLMKELKQLAKDILVDNNINYIFKGNIPNKDIYKYYNSEKIDLFINVSRSEGVPVSIMEAMSCHIPIIAPNVGGVKDMLIDEYNGILLSSEAPVKEITDSLNRYDFFKDDKIRKNSYKIFKDKYSADKNYTNFVNLINILM